MRSLDRRRLIAARQALADYVFTEGRVLDPNLSEWTQAGDEWSTTFHLLKDDRVARLHGKIEILFFENAAIIDASQAALNGIATGNLPAKQNDWYDDEDEGYLFLPPKSVAASLVNGWPMVKYHLKENGSWSLRAFNTDFGPFKTVEEAKAIGDRIYNIEWDRCSDRIVAAAGLDPDQWTFHPIRERSYFMNLADPELKIVHRDSRWHAIREFGLGAENPLAAFEQLEAVTPTITP